MFLIAATPVPCHHTSTVSNSVQDFRNTRPVLATVFLITITPVPVSPDKYKPATVFLITATPVPVSPDQWKTAIEFLIATSPLQYNQTNIS